MSLRSDRVFRMVSLDGGRRVIYCLVGDEGAVTFTIVKMLDELLRDVELHGTVTTDAGTYFGVDVGVHYRLPRDGFSPLKNCVAFDGQECWYDGSSLAGMELAQEWKVAGCDDQVIRYALEGVYEAEFTDG